MFVSVWFRVLVFTGAFVRACVYVKMRVGARSCVRVFVPVCACACIHVSTTEECVSILFLP